MKAAVVTRYGGPDVLEFRSVPIPTLKPDEILVKVRAIGLNFADIFGRFGVYPGTPNPPFIPGLEFAGEVSAVGDRVTLFRQGDRAMGYSRTGSHAEYVAVNEKSVARMPGAMTYPEGASFIVTTLTAYHGIIRLANLRAGERLLIHAAAGGVGLAAVQIGRHLQAEVFATAGSDEKVDLAIRYGAHHGMNYRTIDFAAEMLRLSGDYGADVVMDSVGGDVFRKSWKILAQMGRYVLFGISAVAGKRGLNRLKAARVYSAMLPIFPPRLMQSNKGLFGFNLGTLTAKDTYLREAASDILRLYEIGAVKPVIGSVFPFAKIVEAHRFLQTRRSVGKVVVEVDA